MRQFEKNIFIRSGKKSNATNRNSPLNMLATLLLAIKALWLVV